MLKSDLHTHAKEDRADHISYTAREFIDEAARKGFEVLSLTFHRRVFWKESLRKYSEKKGILLIPGCEMSVENRHVLIYNKSAEKLKRIVERIQKENRIDRIKKHKQDCLVIAPHPYFHLPFQFWGRICLDEKLEEYINAFDAVEYSHFYWNGLNMNRKAVQVAKKHRKTVIGMGDVHRIMQFDYTYSMINAKKDPEAVLQAVRNNKLVLVTRQLPLHKFVWLGILNALSLT